VIRDEALAPPAGRVRLVIDTDAANEIDDAFALAWALARPQRLELLGVLAAPFSFAHRRTELLEARRAREAPASATAWQHELLAHHGRWLAALEARGLHPATWPDAAFDPPAAGLERSVAVIEAVFAACGRPAGGLVHTGAGAYLADESTPRPSAASRHLIHAARALPRGERLHVAALGCLTNVASALIEAPDLIDRLVVVWTAGYPSHAPHPNFSFNLEQDLAAARVVLGSGVPLVYLPGFHVGAQLRLSGAEVEAIVAPRGAIGRLLAEAFLHANPLRGLYGLPASMARRSWVIWDLIVIAWLLEPGWVPSRLVPTPGLDATRRWVHPGPAPHRMREAHAVDRDAVFGDFFAALEELAARG
jgi:inosine-uridine nucleoside N-ribohydrolase